MIKVLLLHGSLEKFWISKIIKVLQFLMRLLDIRRSVLLTWKLVVYKPFSRLEKNSSNMSLIFGSITQAKFEHKKYDMNKNIEIMKSAAFFFILPRVFISFSVNLRPRVDHRPYFIIWHLFLHLLSHHHETALNITIFLRARLEKRYAQLTG